MLSNMFFFSFPLFNGIHMVIQGGKHLMLSFIQSLLKACSAVRSDSTLLRAFLLSGLENPKDRVSTTSLGSLFHSLTWVVLIFSWKLSHFSLCVLSHPLITQHCGLAPPLQEPSCSTWKLPLGLSKLSLLQAERIALPQPLLMHQLPQSTEHFGNPPESKEAQGQTKGQEKTWENLKS